jgi:hypothetical protein
MSILQEGDQLKGAFGRLSVSIYQIIVELTLMVHIGKTMPHVHVLDGWERRA